MIAKLYDPALFAELVAAAGEELAAYFSSCLNKERLPYPRPNPETWTALARTALSNDCPNLTNERFRDLVRLALDHGQRLHDPRYMGHQVPPPPGIPALFDLVGKATNQGLAVFEMGPFAVAAEVAIGEKLGSMIGFAPGTFGHLATSGGTIANITAILAARNARYPRAWREGLGTEKPAIVTSADSHYCIERAAGILGLGTGQVIKVPVDRDRRISRETARECIKQARTDGLSPFVIVGSACNTATGAFDPLPELAALAKEESLWFHVDGAHGASLLFSDKHKDRLRGIELADSVVWDAHKMCFVPSLVTFLFYRNKKHSYAPFNQDAPYLYPRDTFDSQDFDLGLRTFECTKGAISLGLWGLWSLGGKKVFAELVEQVIETTRALHELILASPDFEAAHIPECNILCFRYRDGEQTEKAVLSEKQLFIRRRLLEKGTYYITSTKIAGEAWLRTTIMNPFTSDAELRGLLAEIRQIVAETRDPI